MARDNTSGSFFREHPWMTFFLALAGLKTIETMVRGEGTPFITVTRAETAAR